LQIPTFAEGFIALFYVRIGEDNSFIIREWPINLINTK
jgi:hypothetical protein